jgi:hypothetical protein
VGGKGGSGNSNLSPEVQSGILSNETALTKLAQEQEGNAQKLFNLTEPGLVESENYYSTLAAGDPGAIMRAIAPGAQQVSEATSGAKSNIMANSPAGGEKNLALEMTDVNRGAQVGQMAAGATLKAPDALAKLAGQGIGESQNAAGIASSTYGSASSSLANLGSLNIQDQQLQMQQKGQSLGALGSLGSSAAGVAGGIGESKGIDSLAALAMA